MDQADLAFLRGGYARLGHFGSCTLRFFLQHLEDVSDRFFDSVWKEVAADYNWPLDPLHEWSRVWEYPFVAAQLAQATSPRSDARLLDVGSAVTFFTFYLLAVGFKVTNLDCDPRMPLVFQRAYKLAAPGMALTDFPVYLVNDARKIELVSESMDAIVCLSVLEHIREYDQVVFEFARLLRPGGFLLLTFDIDATGENGLSIAELERLLGLLSRRLNPMTSQELAIPDDVLTMHNSPSHHMQKRAMHRPKWRKIIKLWPPHITLKRCWATSRSFVRNIQRGSVDQNLHVFGGAWQKS